MLTISGRYGPAMCDLKSRRRFLKIGGLALGGVALPQLLRAEAATASGRGGASSHKAIIMVYLAGGPSHQDFYDLKVEAPREIRGEFKPIQTNVPGIQICELLPRLAAMMDKLAIIRSLYGCVNQHESDLCLAGWPSVNGQPQGGQPSLGSVLSKLQGPRDKVIPPFLYITPHVHPGHSNTGDPGFLGPPHAAFKPTGDGLAADLVLHGITLDQLGDRKRLLRAFDGFRRDLDVNHASVETDPFTQRAFELLTSSKLAEALDIEQEDPRLRERYGGGSPQIAVDAAAPIWNEQFLLSRRLVEAGARCVTLAFGNFDTHESNFPSLSQQLPMLDQGLSALIEDLHDRGLESDVSVVAWGEFGRTPRINPRGGRDHWAPVSCALLAGGGMRMGQVIGSTNRLGELPHDRPIHYQDVFATLYRQLGIDVEFTTIPDHRGRPQYLLDRREPIRELV